MKIKISIIIPTYKRNVLLLRCLNALLIQDFNPEEYEIIIADDAADSGTMYLIESVKANSNIAIKYLPVKGKHGPAASRNIGWRSSSAEIIAFTDDDCIPCPAWLKKGFSAFKEGITGVSGKIIVPLSQEPKDYELNTAQLEKALFVTANCFYQREVLEKTGGFDEQFIYPWREDSDLYFTLLEKGYKLIHDPGAIVVHPVRDAPWGISIKEQKKSLFNALLYKKHQALYRIHIGKSFPLNYYIIVITFILFMLCNVYKSSMGLFFFSFLWLFFTFLFFMKRMTGTSKTFSHILEMGLTSLIIPFLSVFWRLTGAIRFRVVFF